MFIDNLRLEIIATYETNEQEIFSCGVWETAIKSQKNLIKYIKEQLSHKDLIKLSLCWICDKSLTVKYKVINDSIFKRNGKYFFENNKLIKLKGE